MHMSLLPAIIQESSTAPAADDGSPATGTEATTPQDVGVAEDLSSWLHAGFEQLVEVSIAFAPRVVLALLVLVIGWIAIKILKRLVGRLLGNKNIDPSVSSFLRSVVEVTLTVLLVLSVLSMIGVEVTSFLAVFTAGAVAIGLALKGTLQNFASGVLLLVKHPFHVGDTIECSGITGTVKEIRFFDTLITTADNVNIIVPNNDLSTKVIKNFSQHDTRRMQVIVGIGYEDDIDKARDIILSLIGSDERFLPEPAPQVVVSELGDSSVNLQVRAWANRGDLSAATWSFNEQVKKSFDREGINLPYPQMEIHQSESG